MFGTIYSQIGLALVVLVVGFAFLKGDDPERVGAGGYALSMLASLVMQSGQVLHGPQWGMFAIDLIMLGLYSGLAWKSRRVWPVWAAALQALIVVGHVMKLLDLGGTATAFVAVINLAGLAILIALGVGTFWAWQERKAANLSAFR